MMVTWEGVKTFLSFAEEHQAKANVGGSLGRARTHHL